MGVNVDALREGLNEYHKGLHRHIHQLENDFQILEKSWRRLDREYEGAAAEEFRQGWLRTSRWFKEYLSRARRVADFLAERCEHLETL